MTLFEVYLSVIKNKVKSNRIYKLFSHTHTHTYFFSILVVVSLLSISMNAKCWHILVTIKRRKEIGRDGEKYYMEGKEKEKKRERRSKREKERENLVNSIS